jgi:hypothetical protein
MVAGKRAAKKEHRGVNRCWGVGRSQQGDHNEQDQRPE